MRMMPRRPWRPLLLLAIGGAAINYKLYLAHVPGLIHDVVGLIPDDLEQRDNLELYGLQGGYGADVHIVLDSLDPTVSLEEEALAWVRRAKVGRSTSGRGMLVLRDFESGRMRFEVTPALQGVFTDAFTGYLLRKHLQYVTGGGQTERGLHLLIYLLTFRVQQALLEEEWDPTVLERVNVRSGLADGGGASGALQSTEAVPWVGSLPTVVRETLGPQPTPAAAWAAYLRWLTLVPFDSRVGLFTSGSQEAPHTLYTRPFQDLELLMYVGRPYRIVERDDMAMAYVTNTPLAWPMLFRRSELGWQVDAVGHGRHITRFTASAYAWGWERLDDDWDRVFDDQFVDSKSGVYRYLKCGDLRPLPYGDLKWD